MISRLGLAISRVFEKTVPDPFVIAIALSLLTFVLALYFGVYPEADSSLRDRAEHLLDSWRHNKEGIWRLLEFSMQMCLILVTGHALAVAPPVRVLIDAVARIPRGTASAAVLVSLAACAAALINWGLGLIVGALLAREVGRSLDQRGIRAHYPLIVAAGYTGMMIWHGGLSGSAPLVMSGSPPLFGETPVPLNQTIFSTMNAFITLGLLAIVPVVMGMLTPRDELDMKPAGSFYLDIRQDTRAKSATSGRARTLPEFLDTLPVFSLLLAAALVVALVRFFQESSAFGFGLNEVNAAMLALGLILHGSPRRYMLAAEQGVRGCAGIIIQFPLYAGIMAMMLSSGLVERLASAMNELGNQTTIPVFGFIAAAIVNMFIPSGGGQWAVQGPIALEAAGSAGIAPGKMIMSVAYGDQLTNMLQPFWALPLLAITGVKARDIVGYTAVAMIIGAVWIALGLLIF